MSTSEHKEARGKKVDIGAVANCVMGKPMTLEQLLDPDFPMNAVRVADELVRIAKNEKNGSTWMAQGALAILKLLERIEELSTSSK